MKKILLASAVALAAVLPAMAEVETVKTLYSGEPKEVSWSATFSVPAADFEQGVSVGDYIYLTFSNLKAYITEDMLATLRETGLEVCGDFSMTSASICNDGFNMPEGAIWGGYFWVDNWKTLELFKTAFNTYAGQRYMDIYISDDNADFTGYFMKVLTNWDDPNSVWADNSQIVHTATMATIDLKDINVKDALASVHALMIQANQESGNPFNITAVVLRNDGETSIISTIGNDSESGITDIYNLQGYKVMSGVTIEEATAALPAGLYISGKGEKFVIR